jgi:hypothetical protein
MINGTFQRGESLLKTVFESGYSNAAASLSKFISDNILGINFHYGFHKLGTREFSDLAFFNRTGANLLITTEVFGDISGKSYLFLSEQDINVLTRGIGGSGNHIETLKDEFLTELDNILSASVITKISNELSMKVYGDIPILVGHTDASINSMIMDDFAKRLEEIYVNAAFFTFENHPTVSPFFVWVVDGNILNTLKEKSFIKKAS